MKPRKEFDAALKEGVWILERMPEDRWDRGYYVGVFWTLIMVIIFSFFIEISRIFLITVLIGYLILRPLFNLLLRPKILRRIK